VWWGDRVSIEPSSLANIISTMRSKGITFGPVQIASVRSERA
jgi:hypothetical protein